VATVWASVLPQRYATGAEALVQALGREAVQTTYTITIYWRGDVLEMDRVLWGGRELDVRRVIDPDGRRTWLELMCEALP
jgi:SPP1 family predicted phage head-tail adaptor